MYATNESASIYSSGGVGGGAGKSITQIPSAYNNPNEFELCTLPSLHYHRAPIAPGLSGTTIPLLGWVNYQHEKQQDNSLTNIINHPAANLEQGALVGVYGGDNATGQDYSLLTSDTIKRNWATKRRQLSQGRRQPKQDYWYSLVHLDPYIDAVHVKNRVNNKRGTRVKAATNLVVVDKKNSYSNGHQLVLSSDDQEPRSSHYSKTVHIEESKLSNDEWNLSSDGSEEEEDDDDDDDDDDDNDSNDKGGKNKKKGYYIKGKGKKYKRPNKKKSYLKVYRPKKKRRGRKNQVIYISGGGEGKHYGHDADHHHHHHHHKDHYNPHHDTGHHNHYNKHHEHNSDQYHEHGKKSQRYHNHNHPKHHHQQHSTAGKLVNLNLLNKNTKTSLAGVLGFTLLCVNYLLILRQPTYDQYSGHYYTKYTPHGGHGDTVELKSGGPVILAHCGELPKARSLRHVLSVVSVPSRRQAAGLTPGNVGINKTFTPNNDQIIEQTMSHTTATTKNGLSTAEQRQQQPRVVFDDNPADGLGLFGGPNYFYTTSNEGQQRQQFPQRNQQSRDAFDRGLLAPLQVALNRLLASRSFNTNANTNDDDGDGQQLRSPAFASGVGVLDDAISQAALINSRGVGRRRVVSLELGAGRPRVIETLDNLINGRSSGRQIGIGMRVVEGRRIGLFGNAQQTVAQFNNNQAQNDQPTSNRQQSPPPEATSGNGGGGHTSLMNSKQLANSLPEFALAGDSIELACNHRLPIDRLYAVKWFKDSLEFFRFVPSDEPRAKTSFLTPDVELDLRRSGPQNVLLRNVTHRSSGQYRCEAVSEAPNFELMSGERQMRVYVLPDTGPQLMVLNQSPNGDDNDVNLMVTTARRARPMFVGERENVNHNEWPPRGERQMVSNPIGNSDMGPLIRCSSARSNPGAQLRFFVNNQLVELRRTVENSTLLYSDGLESSVVAIRLRLADFLALEPGQRVANNNNNNVSPLDRAATFKESNGSNKTTTTETAAKMVIKTTTTTTRKPTMAAQLDANDKGVAMRAPETGVNKKSGGDHNPNAGVLFDDSKQNNDGSKLVTKSDNNKDGPKKRSKKKKKSKKTSKDKSGDKNKQQQQQQRRRNKNDDNSSANSGEHEETQDENLAPDPISPENNIDKEQQRDMKLISSVEKDETNNMGELPATDDYLTNSREAASSSKRDAQPSASVLDLVRLEQQQQQRVYANFVRIKCASLVSTLNYEMISEVNVPLGLLVSPSQLNSQEPRQTTGTSNNDNDQREGDDPGNSNRRSDDNDTDEPPPTQPARLRGPVQANRRVSIDRVAQASVQPISIQPRPLGNGSIPSRRHITSGASSSTISGSLNYGVVFMFIILSSFVRDCSLITFK